MYHIEFLDEYDKVVNVKANENGIIQDADVDKNLWRDQVIIAIDDIDPGDTMMMYDLYSEVLIPCEYKVLSISNN